MSCREKFAISSSKAFWAVEGSLVIPCGCLAVRTSTAGSCRIISAVAFSPSNFLDDAASLSPAVDSVY